ncbi:glycine zipper 2TM domain-containing protein [Ideonella sp. YS5]|uniref:glycine zipper 2TM domain-containing protein n=1 Tax=Ideonella sp. YS5 TaxID=3453714 RepID=UPI003EED1903
MHPSTAAVRPPASRAAWPRSVWVVIALLVATVAALGATLAWQSRAPAEPTVPMALAGGPTEPTPEQAALPAEAPASSPSVVPGQKPSPVAASPRAAAPPAHAVAPVKRPGTPPSPTNGAATSSTPLPTQPAVVSVCNSCGIVEAVEPVQRQGKASGLGAVAGGVVGGAVGNRMGAGSGKTAMTVLGAIGGGFAGNAIEKHAKSETVYRVKVRMEDGSLRTVTQPQTVAVGSHVTLNGETLKVTAPAAASNGKSPAGDAANT